MATDRATRSGFHTVTFGCKLNQFDTAAIEGELTRRGFAPAPDAARAAVVILNTCTVTHRADADARKHVRRIRRENPGCTLLVTGCYAERDAETVRAIPGVDRVFGNRDKPRIGTILDDLGLGNTTAPSMGDRGCDGADLPDALYFGERSRAFLKIQDGCRLACSYCIIPTVRGPSRSVAPEAVERAVRALETRGFGEIVLTGINTGDYGRDLDPATDLTTLLERLLADGDCRLRLNSLEPLTIHDGLIDLMAGEPRLAPHLQVPLQSGSDAVLRAMRRNYRAAQWLERVERLRAAIPQACIGADVIVGFPGETDELFAETETLLERSPVDYLHVFSWPRPGTPASDLPGRLPEAVVGIRSERLREFSERRRRRQRERLVGCEVDAVILEGSDPAGRTRALTGNYVEISLPAVATPRGARVRARVQGLVGDEVRAGLI